MRPVRACAAVAVWMSLTLLLAACASEVAAPPLIAPPPPPPPPRPQPTTRAQVHAEIVRWFAAAGYHDFQVAALVEHARKESGFRPCAAGPAGLRYIFQWGGLRLRSLHEFAGAYRCPPLDTQLAFADNELRNDPNYECFWRAMTKPAALSALRRGFGRGRC